MHFGTYLCITIYPHIRNITIAYNKIYYIVDYISMQLRSTRSSGLTLGSSTLLLLAIILQGQYYKHRGQLLLGIYMTK